MWAKTGKKFQQESGKLSKDIWFSKIEKCSLIIYEHMNLQFYSLFIMYCTAACPHRRLKEALLYFSLYNKQYTYIWMEEIYIRVYREYWMIWRVPGSSPTPLSPSPITSCLSFVVFRCVTDGAYWREKGACGGRGAISFDREKAWPSIHHPIYSLSSFDTLCPVAEVIDPVRELKPAGLKGQ